ncbi:hypothetical protein CTEN210_11506 [Chaetoceros tenuissimus]|uniref:F5/8 type C domain-containing protein n=1 Tax=Chaetoceros tenuissimus TaxID=426638 RepID=A0AAD3D1Y9_9STRA|nr:hypothetical protein CTEN210_11506 [Chaetoceros tenuissimus]
MKFHFDAALIASLLALPSLSLAKLGVSKLESSDEGKLIDVSTEPDVTDNKMSIRSGSLRSSASGNLANRRVTETQDSPSIELYPDWDPSKKYSSYRILSHFAGNGIWDVSVFELYSDADCTPGNKINISKSTATLISSGNAPYAGYEPASAFDESSYSLWGGRRDGEYFWLGYESGPSSVVKCIKINQGNSNGQWMQDSFKIQGKDGDEEWTNLYEVEGAKTSTGELVLNLSETWSNNPDEEPLFETIPDMSDEDIASVMKWIAAEVGMVKNPFCWKDSYGRGVGTLPGRVSDCPSGYTNNGLTCGRGSDDIWAPSKVADCPSGYTNMGYTCFRGTDDISAPSRVADCPSGYTNMGLTCHKWWWPHTLSGGPSRFTCPSGYFKSSISHRCHKNCPEGYTNTGETCHRGPSSLGMSSMTCPEGYFQSKATARCHKLCPPGYTNMGETCHRPVSTLGLDAMTCKEGEEAGVGGARCYPVNGYCFGGEEYDAGLCYSRCSNGFDGVGPVCWGTCDNSQVDCGMACAKTTEDCVLAVADQVVSTLILAANIASLGLATPVTSGVSAGASTITVGGKVVAGTSKAGKALVKLVSKLQTVKPSGLAKGATIYQRVVHAKTGTIFRTIKTSAKIGSEHYGLAQSFRRAFAEDFANQTSKEIEAELDSHFTPETATYLKGLWADRMLTDLADAENWEIASSALGYVSIVDISGVTGVVSAYAKPVCDENVPFPCTDANLNC